jgi:tRNA U34 2-thiouridine synthase MnmA/TrmU
MSARILCLFSGGLDSILATRLLNDAGAEVQAVHFITPFTGSAERLRGESYLEKWGINLRRIRITFEEFRPLLEHPAHGFGRALNPCIDCKILFLKKAGEIADQEGFDAVATGEVLGERPMSQNRRSLDVIEREAGLEARLLRPLSAKLLPQTGVERAGLLDRGKLLDIQGRGRKPQLALAGRWGITEFATPAGGCLLTEPQYASKLKDLLDHPGEAADETVALLKTGRHFRYPEGPKLIVGRDKEENEELLQHGGSGRIFLEVRGVGSPIGLLFAHNPSEEILAWAAKIAARYSDAKGEPQVTVTWWDKEGVERTLFVAPAKDSELEGRRL